MSENVNENIEKKGIELPTGNLGSENPELVKTVELDNPLKQWLVTYVGDKHKPEDGVVTVGMTVETLAEEFPEFLLVVAEENWIRGYRQGVEDSEEGVRLALQEAGMEPKVVVPSEFMDGVSPADDADADE
jgi:hypothetical protein